MPFKDPRTGKTYTDFKDCEKQNDWADDSAAYCAWAEHESTGKWPSEATTGFNAQNHAEVILQAAKLSEKFRASKQRATKKFKPGDKVEFFDERNRHKVGVIAGGNPYEPIRYWVESPSGHQWDIVSSELVKASKEKSSKENAVSYFDRYFDESSRINDSFTIDVDGETHIVEKDALLDMLNSLPSGTKDKIEKKMTEIDFASGDMNNFLEYFLKGYLKEHKFFGSKENIKVEQGKTKMGKCPSCGAERNAWDFMHGSIDGVFTCPACGYATDNSKDFGFDVGELDSATRKKNETSQKEHQERIIQYIKKLLDGKATFTEVVSKVGEKYPTTTKEDVMKWIRSLQMREVGSKNRSTAFKRESQLEGMQNALEDLAWKIHHKGLDELTEEQIEELKDMMSEKATVSWHQTVKYDLTTTRGGKTVATIYWPTEDEDREFLSYDLALEWVLGTIESRMEETSAKYDTPNSYYINIEKEDYKKLAPRLSSVSHEEDHSGYMSVLTVNDEVSLKAIQKILDKEGISYHLGGAPEEAQEAEWYHGIRYQVGTDENGDVWATIYWPTGEETEKHANEDDAFKWVSNRIEAYAEEPEDNALEVSRKIRKRATRQIAAGQTVSMVLEEVDFHGVKYQIVEFTNGETGIIGPSGEVVDALEAPGEVRRVLFSHRRARGSKDNKVEVDITTVPESLVGPGDEMKRIREAGQPHANTIMRRRDGIWCLYGNDGEKVYESDDVEEVKKEAQARGIEYTLIE